MTARCTLDDFIIHNTKEVRVSPAAEKVAFPDYVVPAGGLFDVTLLWGQGYQLRNNGETINPADIGHAEILDRKGKKTGYSLAAYGGIRQDRSSWGGYYIEKEHRAGDQYKKLEQMRRTWQRENEIRAARQSSSSAGSSDMASSACSSAPGPG